MENKKDEDIELDTTKRFEKLQSVFNYSIFPQKEESPQETTDIEENQEESTDIMIEESTQEKEKEDSIDKSLEEIQDEKDRKGIEESPNVEDENQDEEIVQEKENFDCIDEAKEDTKMEEILDSNIITPSTPKYNGYKETIIRYSIFAILSLTFLLISFLGYNSVKRKKTSLIENSTINYSVCLNENHFYETECVGEENKYISSLTNKIKIYPFFTLHC